MTDERYGWPPNAESASAELRRAEEDLVKADAAGVLLAAQLRAAKADVEAWQANANTHLAECLRLEKLVIERTAERDRSRQWLDRWGKEADQLRAELASARQELDRLRNQPTDEGAPPE